MIAPRFESLTVGEAYDRPYLAKLWGYKDWHAIGRGVVTPSGGNVVILFVTQEKQEALTQYSDQFDGELLRMEGETSHASDSRLAATPGSGDSVHLFFRQRHHSPFTYYGEVHLESSELHTGSSPSRFTFRTRRHEATANSSLATEVIAHDADADDFIPDSEGRKRHRMHVSYERSTKNRARAIELHGTSCMVCGFNFSQVYGFDLARDYIEIHHVKSVARAEGPVDPRTDLAPVCSNCHSMLHRRRPEPFSLDELRNILRKRRC